jgi:hypothetical protein
VETMPDLANVMSFQCGDAFATASTWAPTCDVRCSFSAEIYTRGCHWFPRLLASSEQACDQWHSFRVSTFLTSSHCKLRPNTEGLLLHHHMLL